MPARRGLYGRKGVVATHEIKKLFGGFVPHAVEIPGTDFAYYYKEVGKNVHFEVKMKQPWIIKQGEKKDDK